MRRTAHRKPSACLTALTLCLSAISSLSQTTPHPVTPAPSNFAGCVQRSTTDKDIIILSSESVCAKLTGNFAPEKLVNHQVSLKGVLTERTADTPAIIRIGSVGSVGKSCSDSCSLQPPGTRGLRRGEKPGKEGGTPGIAPTIPPQD